MRPTSSPEILVVDDHAAARQSVIETLKLSGYSVEGCDSAKPALERVAAKDFDLIITDLMMPGMDGLQFLAQLDKLQCSAQTVMITAHGSVSTAVQAMRHGAFDYLEKPFDADQLEQIVEHALQQGAVVGKRSQVVAGTDCPLIGDSPAMQLLKRRIRQVAQSDVTVLITGESGTGKELVARAIHLESKRYEQPLVSLNCPALSPQLMESELFGHEQGSFTSANKPRMGRFELADGGTIFLDEVTEIEIGLQAKLLRVLQEKTIERVGSNEVKHVDARVIAATNRDLQAEVAEGRFRDDLFFRLAVVPLPVPSLRERREDILPLAQHFLQIAEQTCAREGLSLNESACQWLQDYHWPGNVRELENMMTRAIVLSTSDQIGVEDIQPDASWGAVEQSPVPSNVMTEPGMRLDVMERQLIESTLERFDGHREKTAKALGIGVRTLTNKLRSYGYAPREKSFQMKTSKAA